MESTAPPRFDLASVVLRPPRIGDMGWVLERQSELFAREEGYGPAIEVIAAQVIARFLADRDPEREFCWIAEQDGERLGSIFLMKDDDQTGRLRLLHVEAAARGIGLGKRLVETCVTTAKAVGYERIRLWTQSDLPAARGIYAASGFSIIETEEHARFGRPQVAETWEKILR